MAINPAKAILRQGRTALFICDVQEKFVKAISHFDEMVQNSKKLISALKILNVPMLVSEQNPKSLGKTIPELDISGARGPFAKMQFSMCTPEINKELATLCNGQKPESIILIGIETHVCVENTAIDLRQYGYEVHMVADCVSSRTLEDRLLALERMRDIGCHITTSENVIFKLIRDASHEKFKTLLTLIKTPTAYTGLVPISKI
ncbi:isochorismatase domain-containing protein 1-like [Monomorium pharaonis]|uniref:isochorismatase domain-containing protein 1 n=1 Tax=Monomorium pharaonis TaxID=307658 RepID=UPI00063F753A|nr:isochorismatase domain-containing protein 1 [Monomorium pharaonis]XP_036138486.1 isochorismatase domain-containing protein 1-like [Monomorium pharaonis]